MRPTRVTVSSQTVSAWIPIDRSQSPFALEIACVCSSNINATYKVQYTVDDLGLYLPGTVTRSATTATLTTTGVNHGLTTTDSVLIRGTGDSNLDGVFTPAAITNQTVLTYTVSNTGATTGATGTTTWTPLHVFDHGTITGKTGNFDGALTVPVTAVRLNITAYTAGYVTMILSQATR